MTVHKMNRREFIRAVSFGAGWLALGGCNGNVALRVGQGILERPNFVIIFCDDLGYADVGCYGAKGFETPNLDRMAAEGMRFTDFYVAAPSCTPSRAALLTGCYPQRIGLPGVLNPKDKIGINSREQTLAELLKPLGYATACYGKWHLGHHRQFLPLHHGFDEYFGLPYSNDMWPYHPERPEGYPDLPLIEGEEIIEYNPDQTKLTTSYTERAVNFIEKNRDRPFFLYVPHSMPHVPLYVSDKFKGKSGQGIYGDVVMELDWSVGRILSALKRLGLDEKTLVLFTSDNGPWLSYGDNAGSALPLREGKGTTWEGGMREPCIMRWPGRIPAGAVCDELCTTMDVLPTFARLAGASLPKKRIDGKDIRPLMSGSPGARSPYEVFYFYENDELQAIRSGKWKLHFPHSYRTLAGGPGGRDGKPVKYRQMRVGLQLYDLQNDIGETTNVADKYPEVVKRSTKLAEEARRDLGDSLYRVSGKNIRKPGHI